MGSGHFPPWCGAVLSVNIGSLSLFTMSVVAVAVAAAEREEIVEKEELASLDMVSPNKAHYKRSEPVLNTDICSGTDRFRYPRECFSSQYQM